MGMREAGNKKYVNLIRINKIFDPLIFSARDARMRKAIGYGHIAQTLKLRVTPCVRPAYVDSCVNAVMEEGASLHVPPGVAPASDAPLAHLQFALRYQGVDLEIIQAASRALAPQAVQAMVRATPNGRYARVIAALYEHFTGVQLEMPTLTAPYVPLFNPDQYLCGASRRIAKYRVDVNGLGPLGYCPVVRRTPELTVLLRRDLFQDLDRFVTSVGGVQQLDRALGWAYLDETRGSFDIEHETLSDDKARRFVQLLRGAHDGRALSEDYLGELQCAVMTNPLLQEPAFRRRQNWLQRGGRLTVGSVTYLPPAPDALPALMDDFMAFANTTNAAADISPLVQAFLVSFGFVYLHPFMDGNGRISRFLVHHSLCRAGRLANGLILPISVAMKRHEDDYLASLQSVSMTIRQLWNVTLVGDDHIEASYLGSADPWRYWDATAAVTFGVRMAHHALDDALIAESAFIRTFDEVVRHINARHDIVGKDLYALIRMAHGNGGTLSAHRRKQYGDRVQPATLDAIEDAVRRVFFD